MLLSQWRGDTPELKVLAMPGDQRIAAQSPKERDACLQQVTTAREQTIVTESTEKRDKPVFNNTPELNVDVRLGKRRLQQRDTYASFSVERRHARIESVTNARRQRIAALSPEERDARLQQLRTAQEHTIATESTEERQPRLQQLRNAQQQRIAAVPPEEREARLQ